MTNLRSGRGIKPVQRAVAARSVRNRKPDSSNEHQPSQQLEEAPDNNNNNNTNNCHNGGGDLVERQQLPAVRYRKDDNDRRHPVPYISPSRMIHISNMDGLRREAARGERVFEVLVYDIDDNGWVAGFDDMYKFLKWDRYTFDTQQDLEDWWFLSEARDVVRDAAAVIARTPAPGDGFYGPDVAGTPYEATTEHLAMSVAGMLYVSKDQTST